VRHGVAIIGLGAVGRRFLALMGEHGRFRVVGGWDPDAAACEAARSEVPTLRIAEDAESLIDDSETDVVYVACPPRHHDEHVVAVLEAGKAVFCEKPLGIDIARSERLVELVEDSELPAAVNFVYGSARAGDLVAQQVREGNLGDIAGVDLRLHFADWPRPWQAHAQWLREREQGGFVREVVSHFVFLTERLLGPAEVMQACVRYPPGDTKAAETYVTATLDCGGVPVSISGQAGGACPDVVEYTVLGAKASYQLHEWYRLRASNGGPWTEQLTEIVNPAHDAYTRQLDNLAAMLDGAEHTMPSFADALRVQTIIEEMLQA